MCRLHRNTGKGILPTYLVHRCRRRRQDRTQPLWIPDSVIRSPFRLFTTDSRRSSTPFYRSADWCACSKSNTLWLQFSVRMIVVCGRTLVSNHVWPLLLLICFFWNSFFRTTSTSPSRKNEPVPYNRLQTLGNQSGTFRQKNIDLLKLWKVSFSTLFQLPSLPPPIALFRCCPRSDLPNFFYRLWISRWIEYYMFLEFVILDLPQLL